MHKYVSCMFHSAFFTLILCKTVNTDDSHRKLIFCVTVTSTNNKIQDTVWFLFVSYFLKKKKKKNSSAFMSEEELLCEEPLLKEH